MPRCKSALALGLVAATALVPATAVARDDDDIMAGEGAGAWTATVFAADGTTSTTPASFGERAFVDRLIASGAAGGTYGADTVAADNASPFVATPAGTAEFDAPDGGYRAVTRSGFAAPDGPRYRRIKREPSKAHAMRKLTRHAWVNGDGERVEEQAFAIDITSGAVRKVSLDRARALSLDPRSGRPGTQYVYQVLVRP